MSTQIAVIRNPRERTALASMLATLVVVPAVGCNMWEAEPPDEVSGTGSAQLALSTEVRRDTDVARVRTTIESCDGKEHQSIEAALHEMRLPGGFEETGVPLDEQSTHRFADAFIVLAAGCYNVESMPLNAHGAPSTQCFPAHAKEIEVVDGKTTEVWLVSQCDGADVGALDTTTVTNHPPTLKSVSYNPSKFIAAGSSVILSVTAEDPDGDPLEFEWTQVGGPDCDLSVLRLDDDDGNERTEQVKITANMSGRYEFKVSIYDLLRDDKGELIRFETYLEQQGDPHASNDSLVLPLYVANE